MRAPRPPRTGQRAPSGAFSASSGAKVCQPAPMISVRITPGQITLARMPAAPYSSAVAFVTATTPALAVEYTALIGDALRPASEDQLMIEPPPSCIARIACLVP